MASSIQHPPIHLKKVLKSYQAAAISSLSGPSTFLSSWNSSADESSPAKVVSSSDEDDFDSRPTSGSLAAKTAPNSAEPIDDYDPFLAPPPFPIQQMPIFTPPDQTRSHRLDTILAGEVISSFSVGGEKRLCLPQILNTVLRNFSLQQINLICDELHIFCSRCNQTQLNELKIARILPASAPSCGLITKTDAERLCNALLYKNPPKAPGVDWKKKKSFKVFHACFGKCKGVIYPELYVEPDSVAVECCECFGMFTPERFVCHAHREFANRTCHWGFDSLNWRSYMLLAKAQENTKDLQKLLDDVKSRFDFGSAIKRKQDDEIQDQTKKVKSEDDSIKRHLDEHHVEAPFWSTVPGLSPWMSSVNLAVYKSWVEKQHQITSQLIQASMMHSPRTNMLKLPSYIESHPPMLLKPHEKLNVSALNKLSDQYFNHSHPYPINGSLQSYSKVPVNDTQKKEDEKSQFKNVELDLSIHSDDSSCSTVTASDDDNDLKDHEVNLQIEDIRQILEKSSIEDKTKVTIMEKVMKMKSIYDNKILQLAYDSEDLARAINFKVTEENQPKKVMDATTSPLTVKPVTVECAD